MNIVQIKTGPVTQMSLDELVVAQAWFQVVEDQIRANGHEVPGDITETVRAVTRELDERLREDMSRALKVAEARLEGLKTVDQKRKDTVAEIAELKARLGVAAGTGKNRK